MTTSKTDLILREAESKKLTLDTLKSDSPAQFFDKRVESEWLTLKEAARYLRVTPNALRIMVFREQVVTHRLGRRLRFQIGDLRSALLSRRGNRR